MKALTPFQERVAAGTVTAPTRLVLERRLERPNTQDPAFFSRTQFETLHAVCGRLIPQPADAAGVDLPGLLDDRLASGGGKGWRYADVPPDAVLFREGLDTIETLARDGHNLSFQELDGPHQDVLLQHIQAGDLPGVVGSSQNARRFFEELLASLVALYFSHPLAKARIDDASYADAKGWAVGGEHPNNLR